MTDIATEQNTADIPEPERSESPSPTNDENSVPPLPLSSSRSQTADKT